VPAAWRARTGGVRQARQPRETKEHTVGIWSRLFDYPANAARRNDIAGQKRPLKGLQRRAPSGLALTAADFVLRSGQLRSRSQYSNRRAEVGVDVVEELDDESMAVQNLLHHPALDALASTVDQADFPQARQVRGADVFVNDRGDVCRSESVQIEAVLDWNGHGVRSPEVVHNPVYAGGVS
jgi:hypothetical protein